MASFQVTPPDQFDFKKPADFEKWFVRFERFKTASGLSEKSQEQQVNALVYCMGKEADDVLKSFGLSDEEQKVYTTVTGKYVNYFNVRRNTIFERARFNLRKQEEGESVRVATVREKVLENEKNSRSGKNQGITFSVREI